MDGEGRFGRMVLWTQCNAEVETNSGKKAKQLEWVVKQPAECAGVFPVPCAAGTCGCRSQHIPSELCGPSSENRSENGERKGRFLQKIVAKQHCLCDREQWEYPSCLLVDAPKDVGRHSRFIFFCT